MTIHEYLKNQRVRHKISQWEVAKALNLTTTQYISNVERGLSPISLKRLPVWCDVVRADRVKILKLLTNQYNRKIRRTLEFR